MMENTEILPLLMDHIPRFAVKKCEIELKETPENKNKLYEIKELLEIDEVTKGIDFEDDYIIQYLRNSKYEINKAFNKLKNTVNLRKTQSCWFDSVPDNYFSTKPSTKFLTIFPNRTPDGCVIFNYRLGEWDPDELSVTDLKRIWIITGFQSIRDTMTQINGFKFIFDFKGTSVKHLKLLTPQSVHLGIQILFQCLPGRYKEMHAVNETIFLNALWKATKFFFPKKFKDRVFFHSDVKELLEYFPASILPEEYGGKLKGAYESGYVRTLNSEQEKSSLAGQPNFF